MAVVGGQGVGRYYVGFPGHEYVPQKMREPDKAGTRSQRRAWAKKHGQPMPKKVEGEDGQQEA